MICAYCSMSLDGDGKLGVMLVAHVPGCGLRIVRTCRDETCTAAANAALCALATVGDDFVGTKGGRA